MDQHDPAAPEAKPPAPGYFSALWNGKLPLARLFWRDMIVVGTAINAAATLAAVLLLALDVPAPAAVAVHFAPLPWNIFLFACVWRATTGLRAVAALACQAGATLWLLAATIV